MSFTSSVTLPCSPDEAFALLTQPERLRRWQTVSATVDLRAGGDYRWVVTPGHIAEGTFTEVEPGRRLVFGWGWNGNPELPRDASTVTVTFAPEGDGTVVTLTHEGLTEQQAAMHAEGWNHYLERLEKIAATGDAGMDEWAWAPEELTPTTAADAALASMQPVLRGLTDADRTKQTPCTDFTCHELAEHLFGSLEQLGAMAGATVVDPEEGSLEHRVSTMAAQAIDAWRAVDLDGTITGPGGQEMPAAALAGVLGLEICLHAWDFAQASGQELRMSDEVIAYLAEQGQAVIPSGRGRSFGDEVAPADDASPLDRLAAFSGRTAL